VQKIGAILVSLNQGAEWNINFYINIEMRPRCFDVNPKTGDIFLGVDTGPIGIGNQNNLFRSSDGGLTWSARPRVGPGTLTPPSTEHPQRTQYPSIRALAHRFEGELFAGTSEGVFRSTDNWETWEDVSEGLGKRDVRAIVVTEDGTMVAGTANAGFFRSTYLVAVELSTFALD